LQWSLVETQAPKSCRFGNPSLHCDLAGRARRTLCTLVSTATHGILGTTHGGQGFRCLRQGAR
jgi:hypothetical protein